MRLPITSIIAAAVTALTSFATMVHAEDLPADLERKEYLAYLALSDMIRAEFSDDAATPMIACLSTASRQEEIYVSAPSVKLLRVMGAEFAKEMPKLIFKSASECGGARERVRDKSSGQPASIFYAYPLDSLEIEGIKRIGCTAQYAAGWHAAPLWGNGYFYEVLESSGYVTIERSPCRSAE